MAIPPEDRSPTQKATSDMKFTDSDISKTYWFRQNTQLYTVLVGHEAQTGNSWIITFTSFHPDPTQVCLTFSNAPLKCETAEYFTANYKCQNEVTLWNETKFRIRCRPQSRWLELFMLIPDSTLH